MVKLRFRSLKAGQSVEFRYDSDNTLTEIAVIHSPFHQTIATQSDGSWTISQRYREAEIYIEHARATIDSSLFLAGARAGLSDNLIMELADIYGHVIDFVHEIRKGDQFVVTFEKRYLDGEFVEYGNILAAEFINSGESFIAVRYEDIKGDIGYYDQNGVSLRKAFYEHPSIFAELVQILATPESIQLQVFDVPIEELITRHRQEPRYMQPETERSYTGEPKEVMERPSL